MFSINKPGQSNKVSPKLDFDETASDDRNSNGSVTTSIMPGTAGEGGAGRGVGSGFNADDDNLDTGKRNRDGHRGEDKSGPKIHGVRVTVDTGDTQKSKESKESVESTDGNAGSKQKKRVGIHTDITFEITADGDVELNTTNPAQGDKEDASVPIFKGRGGSSNSNPRKSYDGKSYWSPNYSDERHGFENAHGYGSYYPGNAYNVPVYTSGSESSLGSANVYRRSDGWNSYTPTPTQYWTTERAHTENYRPNILTAYRTPTWKPCYCATTYVDSRKRREVKKINEKLTNSLTVK